MWGKRDRFMARIWYILSFVALSIAATSCAVLPSDFAIEGIEIIDDEAADADNIAIELTLRNDSQRNITIRSAQIVAQIKGDDLITFALLSEVELPAQTTTSTMTSWGVERNDPATLYSMRRYPIERYVDRLTFDYAVSVGGIKKNDKILKKRGLSAADLDINFEKLLR